MHYNPSFSAVRQVECQTDGRVSPALLRAARAVDRASPHRHRPAAIGKVTLKPGVIIEHMAGVILAAWAARGDVWRQDFERAGVSPADIDRHAAAAFTRAAQRDPRIAAMTAEQAA